MCCKLATLQQITTIKIIGYKLMLKLNLIVRKKTKVKRFNYWQRSCWLYADLFRGRVKTLACNSSKRVSDSKVAKTSTYMSLYIEKSDRR